VASVEPLIADSARKHGVPDEHAQFLEVAVVVGDAGAVIVHAMPARRRFLR
jgi:hypothetical protein